MKILVLGATGFIANLFIQRLVKNNLNVIALSRLPIPMHLISYPSLKWIKFDILNENFDLLDLPKIDVAVHLAGRTSGASDDEDNFLLANERTTVRLCQLLSSKTSRFIFASSQSVYGDANSLAVKEDFPLKPDFSSYACSKVNSENWVRLFQKRSGVSCIVLRFCGFIEGGGIVDYLIEKAMSGKRIELFGNGKVFRDYIPISDAITLLNNALNYSRNHDFLPVNIGSGQFVSSYDLAKIICHEVNSSSEIKFLSNLGSQGNFIFCIDRAKEELNFKPSDLIESVRHYVKIRLNNGKSYEKN